MVSGLELAMRAQWMKRVNEPRSGLNIHYYVMTAAMIVTIIYLVEF